MTWIHVSRRVANKLHLEQVARIIENLNLQQQNDLHCAATRRHGEIIYSLLHSSKSDWHSCTRSICIVIAGFLAYNSR